MNSFYTAEEAATWLTDNSGNKTSSRQVFDLVKSELLPVCFSIKADLFNATIQSPDGSIEKIKLDVPIDGVVKSLVSPRNKETLSATLITVLRVDGMQFSHKDGALVKGHRLPTTENHGGEIKPGYIIKGWLNFFEVPSTEWLFSIDDLHSIADQKKESSNVPTTGTHQRKSVATQQADAILNWLKSNNNDPLKLPVPPSGKAGVKKLCRDALCESSKQLFSSISVFNTVWDRLRQSKEIKDA